MGSASMQACGNCRARAAIRRSTRSTRTPAAVKRLATCWCCGFSAQASPAIVSDYTSSCIHLTILVTWQPNTCRRLISRDLTKICHKRTADLQRRGRCEVGIFGRRQKRARGVTASTWGLVRLEGSASSDHFGGGGGDRGHSKPQLVSMEQCQRRRLGMTIPSRQGSRSC